MTLAVYLRVSSTAQSVGMQRTDLQRFCEQRRFEIYREYVDEGISGTKDRRPGLDALMGDARKRLFDGVLVWRFDRFARSTKHLISALEEFRHLGIEFFSYQENIDTSSPLGRVIFIIVSAIAELERNIIIERIRGGLRKAKASGVRLGRPGLAVDVAQIRQLQAEGLSMRGIAKKVRVSPSYICRLLKVTAPSDNELIKDC